MIDGTLARVEELRNSYKIVIGIVAKSKQTAGLWQSVKILSFYAAYMMCWKKRTNVWQNFNENIKYASVCSTLSGELIRDR